MTPSQKLDTILSHLKKQGEDIDRINRGLYGDPDNKTPGLIERQLQDEQRLKKLEDDRKRQRYWTAGLVTGLQTIWFFLVKFFVK